MLAALVEKPCEIVTKEELQERIWKDDTYVDFDRSLATAVNKVRQALGDSATRPRFIETVPRRGYRFVGLSVEQRASEPEPAATRRPWAVVAAILPIFVAAVVWRYSASEKTVTWGDPVRITSDAGLTFQPTISPDGTLLAYASDKDGQGNLDIYVQQIGGGGLVRLTDDPADDTAPDFSPDGKTVVFRSERGEGGVFAVPSLGGSEPRSVAAQGHRPRFSPDGKWIAYFTAPRGASSPANPLRLGAAYVVPVAGGSPRPIAPELNTTAFPVWSPDSSTLLVVAEEDGSSPYHWRLIDLDGTSREVAGTTATPDGWLLRLGANIPEHWDSEGYVYVAPLDVDGTDLWRVQVDRKSVQLVGGPESVLPGTVSYSGSSLADNGRLVFASLDQNIDIWSLPIDPDSVAITADQPLRLTSSSGVDARAQLSHDGKRMVFRSTRAGKIEYWLHDLGAGVDSPIGMYGLQFFVLDPAGSRVIGRVDGVLSILTLSGVVGKTFPDSQGIPQDWALDDRVLLRGRENGRMALSVLDAESGQESIVLADRQREFYQGQISFDGRWLTWMTPQGGVQAAPFRGAQTVVEPEQIQISEIGPWADKPRWSPNGNVLYYVSDRDGWICLYAQNLDPETKQPRGELQVVYHSHEAQRSMGKAGVQRLWVDVAQDKIVFDMVELKGNIWMMEPEVQ